MNDRDTPSAETPSSAIESGERLRSLEEATDHILKEDKPLLDRLRDWPTDDEADERS